MKTIILCGGKGTRLAEETEFKPKALVQIGGYPILLHIMNIYAHYGYKEFILALGYKGDMIKDYFLNLSQYEDDFEFNLETGKVKMLNKTLRYDYKIIFAETGEKTLTAGRVLRASKYLPRGDKHFMVTYGDGVSTIDVGRIVKFHMDQEKKHGILGTISAVHPTSGFGNLKYTNQELVASFREKEQVTDEYINGGFQVFSKGALEHFGDGEMLEESLTKLTKDTKLALYRHAGYWKSLDTMKDYLALNADWKRTRPWAVWEKNI